MCRAGCVNVSAQRGVEEVGRQPQRRGDGGVQVEAEALEGAVGGFVRGAEAGRVRLGIGVGGVVGQGRRVRADGLLSVVKQQEGGIRSDRRLRLRWRLLPLAGGSHLVRPLVGVSKVEGGLVARSCGGRRRHGGGRRCE